ncbi:MAG: hypothetical protein JST96_18390 [Bacteroidetes bacterium]|nr:hypothetical protein [Bacteroidota bacterium]
MRKDIFLAGLVSAYIVAYCILLQVEDALNYALMMLALSPLLLIGLVIVVLKDGKYSGKELGENEFGYQDKDTNSLGMF